MRNGTTKYLMIALSAVFLWSFSVSTSDQELEKIILPMEEVQLIYKEDNILITRKHAEQLDKVILHMRSKPRMSITFGSQSTEYTGQFNKARLKVIKAYMLDNGIKAERLVVSKYGAGCSHCETIISIREN